MNFYDHSKLKGQHATLSASQFRWINYDPNKLADIYFNSFAQTVGTTIHEFAFKLINQKMRLDETNTRSLLIFYLREKGIPEFVINNLDVDGMGINLANYVNDAIGFGMVPEQVLYYSENCFGTADAISFYRKRLRIHDLKTGTIPAHMEQLEIYAALFCLEYKTKPKDIATELRIYQGGDILICEPDPAEIMDICDKIIHSNSIVESIKQGGRIHE